MRRSDFIGKEELSHGKFCDLCENQIITGECHCAIFSSYQKVAAEMGLSLRRVGKNSTIISPIEPFSALTADELLEARGRMEELERALRDNEQI